MSNPRSGKLGRVNEEDGDDDDDDDDEWYKGSLTRAKSLNLKLFEYSEEHTPKTFRGGGSIL